MFSPCPAPPTKKQREAGHSRRSRGHPGCGTADSGSDEGRRRHGWRDGGPVRKTGRHGLPTPSVQGTEAILENSSGRGFTRETECLHDLLDRGRSQEPPPDRWDFRITPLSRPQPRGRCGCCSEHSHRLTPAKRMARAASAARNTLLSPSVSNGRRTASTSLPHPKAPVGTAP